MLIICRIICVTEMKTHTLSHKWLFLWLKFVILLQKKVPSNMVKGTFEKVFKKLCQISRKKMMKQSRFLEELGRFIAFFFWNRHIKLIGSNGRSPTCNRIPKFCTSLFVLYRFGIMGFVQIWLNPLVPDCCFWCNMRNLKIKKHCFTLLPHQFTKKF